MNRQKSPVFLISLLCFFCLLPAVAWADKAGTSIEAPASVAKGAEITILVNITHSAHSFVHHVVWLRIMANDKEVFRWDYSATNRPEAANFTKEVRLTIRENTEIKAEASCNMHGSKGPAVVVVAVKD